MEININDIVFMRFILKDVFSFLQYNSGIVIQRKDNIKIIKETIMKDIKKYT